MRRWHRAAIVYHVDAGQLRLPLAVSKVEAQHVSYQESPCSPQPGNSTGTLIVKYPHPQAKPETALAEVVIDSRPSGAVWHRRSSPDHRPLPHTGLCAAESRI